MTTVRRGSIVQNLTVSGNLTALPNRDAKIAALVPGRIERVLVTEGDSVHSGQVVAQVDPVSLRDQLVQADAAVSQARANVENARIAAERNGRLAATRNCCAEGGGRREDSAIGEPGPVKTS